MLEPTVQIKELKRLSKATHGFLKASNESYQHTASITAQDLSDFSYETGDVYVEEHDKYDVEVFLSFLKNVVKLYPTGKIVIILDNARIHHAKFLHDFLNEYKDWLTLVFLALLQPKLKYD